MRNQLDDSEVGCERNLSLETLERWVDQLSLSYPVEFSNYFKNQEAAYYPPVNREDYFWQLYLWVAFWPLSMMVRLLREIVSLRLLRTVVMRLIKSLGFVWDFVEKRHAFVIKPAEAETTTVGDTATVDLSSKSAGTSGHSE